MEKWFVSIILLNYNWKKFNKNCIDSILSQNYKNFEIVFVDNCSTDWSLEEVEFLYKKEIKNGIIKIVKSKENRWFTWWNNLWVINSNKSGEYICLLNNDTIVPVDWLEKMVQSIEKDSKLWAVSCVVLDKWYEKKINKYLFEKKKKCVSTIFWEVSLVSMEWNEFDSKFYYTTSLNWCCFMYKRNIIDIPFPEYYFIYAEDLYLSRFIVSKWYKMWVCLDTSINHDFSPTFWRKPSPLKLFLWNRNQIINFLVFYPLFYRILLFPLFFIKEIAHLFMWAPLMRFKAKIKWIFWILKNYWKIKSTRCFINENRKIWYYDFTKQQKFLLSDLSVVDNKILKVLIYIWNCLFLIYWKIISLIFLISDFFQNKIKIWNWK